MAREEVIPQHVRGERIEAMHMCPECGGRPLIWCKAGCRGTGLVTTLQLDIWQQKLNAEVPV
jgi:hypothetical protein